MDIKKVLKDRDLFPIIGDENFQKKIYEKREFFINKTEEKKTLTTKEEIKTYRDEICGREFKLSPYQQIPANFINPNTPYSGLLLFYGVGTGKTCTVVNISEQFKANVDKYGTKIYVLGNGPLNKENFKNEIITCTGETYLKKIDGGVKTSQFEKQKNYTDAVNSILKYYRFMSYRSFYKKVLGEKIIERTDVSKTYRKNEDGEYQRDISTDRIEHLNHTLLIIDEAHNITGNEYGEAIKEIKKKSKNLKIIAMTATPAKNLGSDGIELINIIRPENDQIIMDKVFDSNKNYLMDFKEGGVSYLRKMVRGYVSYIRGGDPLTFAERVEMGVVPKGLLFTKLTRCILQPFQLAEYIKVSQESSASLDRKSEAAANIVYPTINGSGKLVGISGKEGIKQVKDIINANNDGLTKKLSAMLNIKDSRNAIYVSNDTLSGFFLKKEYLRDFSTKFYESLVEISGLVEGKKGPGTAFIYSNLVKVGIEVYHEILIQNGYIEYDPSGAASKIKDDTKCYYCGEIYSTHKKEHKFYPSVFLTVTGGGNDEVDDPQIKDKHKIIRTIFNHIDNKEGKNIKIIIGSKVMNEGVTLANIAEEHLIDVYFNLGRVEQVVGRGIRYCKHYHSITEKNPNPQVRVYKYVVSYPDKNDPKKCSNELTSEEELYKKAEIKFILVKKVENIFREEAIDCPLNINNNIFPEEIEKHKGCEKDNSCPAVCGYTNCEYKCADKILNAEYYDSTRKIYKNVSKNKLDYSTFVSSQAIGEINFAKKIIKDLYKLKTAYSLEEIITNVKDKYPIEKIELFDDFFVYRALNDLIPIKENDFNNFKDTIFNLYNIPGYLIYRGEYYIFQPFNQNEDAPLYYRTATTNNILPKLTLDKYLNGKEKYQEHLKKEEIVHKSDTFYDFESVIESYYGKRKEFEFVGVIDKPVDRRGNISGKIEDVFKIRSQRDKNLDKQRGTDIPSLKGSVCSTSKNKEFLINIAKKLQIPNKFEHIQRSEICNMIMSRLLFLEKYSTHKDNMTYIMIPRNHPKYQFPYNLEDRLSNMLSYLDKKNIKSHVTKEINKETFVENYTDIKIYKYKIDIENGDSEYLAKLGVSKKGSKYMIELI